MTAPDPRRIAFCTTVDWYFCHHYLALARAVREAGFTVSVITGVAEHADLIRDAGLDLIPLAVSRKGMNPLRELQSILALKRILRCLRPALLHNIAQKPVLYGTLAARLAGVPAVVNGVAGMGYLFTSGSGRARLLRPLVGRAYRALLAAPNVRVLVQNPDDQRQVRRLTGVEPVLIPGSGVDLTRFVPRPEPPGPPVVVLASRMLWDKGIGEFVAAARLLRERGSPARLVLVGKPDPGNPASVAEDQLRDWAREGCIQWWGYRADMPAVMAAAHIACLPSYYREGLPKFLIEAAAAGLPLVTTDATGCREAVEPEKNGLLVPPRDPDALADALERLAGDEDLRRRFGARSRVLAQERFDATRIHGATLAVYDELLKRCEVHQ
ncbi:glycosyltransferase family 4 protein [Candidatus Thiodictyon syntrophicum]|jgi:glycosyltransferase involved in cell wall biosynthesis|uniref:Glycosyltransferase family 1 protein n=1 Tax=Candidatus Thiodictyon syntrophicum TaxID=1166950 RepID=A0A2K8UG68_9GAMM|nr:glycosyltransferase family 4 protein [Candidatus Thiodictyon syntrophicum]AUB84527.1 glycosyltransferase family 1 protein [Candidatus Thiodictyon syntrophicum]